MPFVLTIAEGKARGQKFQFDSPSVTIGRGAENDVVLNDGGVSRTHARIEQQAGAWMLLDNGSANGTELNGSTIDKPRALKMGDRIGVGPVTFEFSSGDETRITSAPARKGEEPASPATGGARRAQHVDAETRIASMPAGPRELAPKAGAAAQQRPSIGQTWSLMPMPLRLLVIGGAALIVIGIAVKAMQGQPEKRGLECPDTVAVDDDVAGFSFGHGEVDVDCGSKVVFGFNAPQNTRVLFHYVAMRVATPSEVELRVNGKHLGWAPVSGARGEPQILTLPQEAIPADGKVFVSVSEADKGKEWGVGKVRVETLAITPGDIAAARSAYDRGRRKLEERRIAPRNLYDAWKAFTEARRQMEGLSAKPPLYDEVAQLIKDCERDLDKQCSKLLFSAQRFERYGQDERAQQTYREVLLHFPGEDPTGCRKKAQENIVSAQTQEAADQ